MPGFVVVKCIQGILSVSAKSWQPVGVSVVADHVHALDYHSQSRLLAPMMLVGFTALSVLISTNR